MTTITDSATIIRDIVDRLQKHESLLSSSSSTSSSSLSLPAWLASVANVSTVSSSSPLAALGTLFQAYDNRIDELTTSNRTLLDNLSKAKVTIENLLQENTTLRTTNAALVLQHHSGTSSSSSISSIQPPLPSTHSYTSPLDADKALLTAELASIREEVNLLRRKNTELTQDIVVKEQTLTSLTHQYRTIGSSLSSTQAALRHIDTEKRKIETENKKYTRLLTELQEQRDNYYLQLTNLQKELFDSSNQIQQYRTALNELSTAAANESDTLSTQTKQAIERSDALKQQNEELLAQLDTARNELTILRQETLFLRSDGERMLKTLKELESKVVGIEEREELARTAKITADTIKANAEHEISVAKQNEEDTKQELLKILQRRKEEIVAAQQHETEAVNHVRTRLTETINARDTEINSLRQEIVLTKEMMERTNRELRRVIEEKKQLKENFTAEQEKLNQIIPELTQRVTLAEEGKVIAESTAREASLKMTTTLATYEITKQDLLTQLTVTKETIDRLTLQVTEYESKVRSLSLQLTETERSLHLAKRENQELRIRLNETTTALSLHQSKGPLNGNGGGGGSLLHSFLGKDDRASTDRLGQETAYIDEIAELKGRIQELTSLLHAIQKDYTAAITAAKEADETLGQVRNAYIASEGIIVELTSQLNSATQREDARLREVQEARTSAELAKLTNVRIQSKLDTLITRYEQTEKENIEIRAQLRALTMGPIHGNLSTMVTGGGFVPMTNVRPPFVPSSSRIVSKPNRHNPNRSKDDDNQSWISNNSIESNDMDEKLGKLGIAPQPLDPYTRSALVTNASLSLGLVSSSSKVKKDSKSKSSHAGSSHHRHHPKHRHSKENEPNVDEKQRISQGNKEETVPSVPTNAPPILTTTTATTQRSLTTVEIMDDSKVPVTTSSSVSRPPQPSSSSSSSSVDIMSAVQAKIDKFYGIHTVNTNPPAMVPMGKETAIVTDAKEMLTKNEVVATTGTKSIVDPETKSVASISIGTTVNTVPTAVSDSTVLSSVSSPPPVPIHVETDEIVPVLNSSTTVANGRITTTIPRLPSLRGSSPVVNPTPPSLTTANTNNTTSTIPTLSPPSPPSSKAATGTVVPVTPPSQLNKSLSLHDQEHTPSPEKVLEMMTTDEDELVADTMDNRLTISAKNMIIPSYHDDSKNTKNHEIGTVHSISSSTPVSTVPSTVHPMETVTDTTTSTNTSAHDSSSVPVSPSVRPITANTNTPQQESNGNSNNLFTIENSHTPSSIIIDTPVKHNSSNLSHRTSAPNTTSPTATDPEHEPTRIEDISDYYCGEDNTNEQSDSFDEDDEDDEDKDKEKNKPNNTPYTVFGSTKVTTTMAEPSSFSAAKSSSSSFFPSPTNEFGDTNDVNLLSPRSDDFDDEDDQLEDEDDDAF